MTVRAVRVLLVAIVAALGAVACGVPTDDAPREFSLSGELEAPPVSSPTSVSPSEVPDAQVFLIQTNQSTKVQSLWPQGVDVPPNDDDAAYIRSVLDTLIATQPTEPSITNFTQALELRAVEVDGNVVRLTFSDLGSIASQGLILAVAQIVFTATAADGVDGVSGVVFYEESDGQVSPVQVAVEDNRTRSAGEAVIPSDFPQLYNALTIPESDTATTPVVPPTPTTTATTTPAPSTTATP